jgi:hypothetical protein
MLSQNHHGDGVFIVSKRFDYVTKKVYNRTMQQGNSSSVNRGQIKTPNIS